jgi:hypothetical protein
MPFKTANKNGGFFSPSLLRRYGFFLCSNNMRSICSDSSGFLSTLYNYKVSGGDMSRIGIMGTLDFRFFLNGSNITNILSSLPNQPRESNTYYIPAQIFGNIYQGWQIYANVSTLGSVTEPSNLSVSSVCTRPGENTVIKEGSNYFLYYLPRTEDVVVGIDNSSLKTFKNGNSSTWTNSGNSRFGSGVYSIVTKDLNGYNYSNITKSTSYSTGYNIINPRNIIIKDLIFKKK